MWLSFSPSHSAVPPYQFSYGPYIDRFNHLFVIPLVSELWMCTLFYIQHAILVPYLLMAQ